MAFSCKDARMNAREIHGSELPMLDRRYTLGRVIAHGGMGIVREATHIYLKTTCAVKLPIESSVGDPRTHERLLREAAYLMQARHPNVVPVFDAGECSTYGAYLVMGLLKGRPLDGYVTSRTRIPLAEMLPILSGLADALTTAHSRGIVHRDIKPGNVVLVPQPDGSTKAVLVDFGIACHASEDAPGTQSKLTKPGELPGTLEYLAPEFLAGREANHRVDLYALGVLVFECLTGLVPYPGGFVAFERASIDAAPQGVLERCGFSKSCAEVVARAIALDPAGRFPSARAFYEALVAAHTEERRISERETAQQVAATADAVSRRAHARAAYVAPLRVTTPNGGDVDGRTEDVAEGGVLLISQQPFVQGDRVMVRIPLPMTGRLETIPAVVRWAKPGRLRHATGLAFDEMSDRARDEIRQYIEICSRVAGNTETQELQST